MSLRALCVPIVAATLLVAGTIARAEAPPDKTSPFGYAKLGTAGLGAGIGILYAKDSALRIGVSGGSNQSSDERYSGIDYRVDGKPGTTLEALLDWYPITDGGFRLTAGVMAGNAKAGLEAKPDAAGNYSLDGHTYSAATVGTLKASVKYNRVMPYFGVGWESSRPGTKGWRLISDVGVTYRNGRTTLSASGATTDSALRRDLDAESRQLASDLKQRYGVAASVGVAFAF